MDKFYQGFCNRTIWPLFHYFPSYAVFDEEYWRAYETINQAFCDAALEIIQPGDLIWVQDYHLMLLPKLLRDKLPQASIGFFLHIPFPSYEIFRLLPALWRRQILEGLLGADLVGFHTHHYAQYFLRCVSLLLGYEHDLGMVTVREHLSRVDTFPMGIDFQKFHDVGKDDQLLNDITELPKNLRGFKIVLSIDRLDYSKGILNRLRGYEKFLNRNLQWRQKVVLMLVVVPSRTGVEHYQLMKRQIDEMVGKINGAFGNMEWTPILYQYTALDFHPLTELYRMSDVCLVTPLRDGMNLIAKEYVASKSDQTGVLILSEMAGAAMELGEAIIINPNNIEEIANALKEALDMPPLEQIRRNTIMQRRVQQYDVFRWADDFIGSLMKVKEEQQRLKANMLMAQGMADLVERFRISPLRLLFIDYDGTLVPFEESPELAQPSGEILAFLELISAPKETDVVLISGRDRETLQKWFGHLDLALVAEHGAWIKERRRAWRTLGPLRSDWKDQLRPIFQRYADLVSRSLVEEKEFSLVWHFRRAEPELAERRAKELTDDLTQLTANLNVQVLQGHKIVEIRNVGVDKGAAARHFASARDYDFVLAVGDDWTDEDMFKALPEKAHTIRVGLTATHARYNLYSSREVLDLISRMTA
jgi:trehalose 6-phosphate synthase/phosphatase